MFKNAVPEHAWAQYIHNSSSARRGRRGKGGRTVDWAWKGVGQTNSSFRGFEKIDLGSLFLFNEISLKDLDFRTKKLTVEGGVGNFSSAGSDRCNNLKSEYTE